MTIFDRSGRIVARPANGSARAGKLDAGHGAQENLSLQPGMRSLEIGSTYVEPRSAERTMTIYRLVQVEHDGDEGLARCRNISDTGMKLDARMPMAVGDGVKVTFSPTFTLLGRIIWLEGTECGVAFEGKIDCADLLRRSATEAQADGTREPRLNVNLPARMILDGCSHQTLVSDISQRGMKLTHDNSLRPGSRVQVILKCGATKTGIVRWANDTFAGLLLSEPFSVDDLGSKLSL